MPTRLSHRPGSFALPALVIVAAASFLLGASCESAGKGAAAASEKTAADPGEARIDTLPGVDVSSLTASERARWVDLVNDRLSPCGEPVSVASCVAEKRGCSACVPAARYLARLTADGFEQAEINEYYAARYDADSAVEIPIDGAPVRGAPMAPVTIVEFSDFECPYCGAAHPLLRQVLERFDGKVKLVFKQYPLSGHENALPAALASVAAQQQEKFWAMADLLFEHQHELSRESIRELAEKAQLDMAKFDAAWDSEAVAAKVEADRAEGRKVGVQGTPTLFVNGRRFAEPLQNLPKYLDEELGR